MTVCLAPAWAAARGNGRFAAGKRFPAIKKHLSLDSRTDVKIRGATLIGSTKTCLLYTSGKLTFFVNGDLDMSVLNDMGYRRKRLLSLLGYAR